MLHKKPIRRARQSSLDVPTYTIAEAAAFLAIPRRTMYRWFSGADRLFDPSARIGEFALLSFRDIAQAYMLFVLREFHEFPTQRIAQALKELKKESNSTHPLLSLDIKVFGSKLLFDKPARGSREREIIDLSSSRNLALAPVVDAWGKRILQDQSRRSLQLFPWRHFVKDSDSRPVSMDPNVMSGRLVVTGTRIPVSILVGLRSTGKTAQEIARSYRLNAEIVEKALSHIEPPLQKVA